MKLSKLCLIWIFLMEQPRPKVAQIPTMLLPVQHQRRARGSVLVCVVLVALQAIDCRNVGATGGSRVEGLLQEAQVLMQRKDFGSALPLLQEAVSVAPDHAAARFSLGMALLRSGKHIDAVRELEVMMLHHHRGEGELPPTQNLKMHSHHCWRIKQLQRVTQTSRDNIEAWISLGVALMQVKHYSKTTTDSLCLWFAAEQRLPAFNNAGATL